MSTQTLAHSTDSLDQGAIQQLNDFAPLLSFQRTWLFEQLIAMPHKIVGLFTGNQFGKSNSAIVQYILRFLGLHLVPEKNFLYFRCESCNRKYHDSVLRDLLQGERERRNLRPEDNVCACGGNITMHRRVTNTYRFCSETLPGEAGEKGSNKTSEVKNTLYPALRKWLPPFMVDKDISARNPAMRILNPNYGVSFGGLVDNEWKHIVVEFMSYNQSAQSGAGVQRLSALCDEEPPWDFWEELHPRMLAEDGDIIIALTPANKMSWTYDDVYCKAALFVRTQAVCDYQRSQGDNMKRVEVTESNSDIAVLQAATDDNPTLNPSAIERMFDAIDDPDVAAIRRFGIHRQVKGRIFKEFDFRVHVVDPTMLFSEEDEYRPPGNWRHARMIDYHESNAWAVTWIAISPEDEAFVYMEMAPSPERFTTLKIAQDIHDFSGQQKYDLNLIDPLANKKQSNTSTTVVEDLNVYFHGLARESGSPGSYWEPWDTKSTRGREEIRKRVKNSLKVQHPNNNMSSDNEGRTVRLPTIWFFSNCKEIIRSMRHWRYEEWTSPLQLATKDSKEVPTQKFSHFPMTLEAVFKDQRFKAPRSRSMFGQRKTPTRFQTRDRRRR